MVLLLDVCYLFYGSQAWRFDSPDYKSIGISGNKSVRNIYKKINTTHTWILGPLFLVNCNNAPFVFYIQYRIIIIHWFLLVRNMKVAMQIHHLVVKLHILKIITFLTYVCVQKVIRPQRLDNIQQNYDYFRTSCNRHKIVVGD